MSASRLVTETVPPATQPLITAEANLVNNAIHGAEYESEAGSADSTERDPLLGASREDVDNKRLPWWKRPSSAWSDGFPPCRYPTESDIRVYQATSGRLSLDTLGTCFPEWGTMR
jgi:hypothetical protein